MRAEIEAVICEEGHAVRLCSKAGMKKLKKPDSVIKGSQRMNPAGHEYVNLHSLRLPVFGDRLTETEN